MRSAALLIDFDNVTMNVRSDLGKELKSLLDSDVFRGKIAVRRAYADWRRYPACVVPLTEASVDLIFAPAYGTSKKNATDLRMAVDAIELAFMRPEIGVFILLTGDSDFSSCVMKLKEYGKYVIGVGMRESASDLLIQNCDEYYSYHNLSGLTRATDDTGVREDPWELVTKAAQMMARRGDVMRVDRLKQVMVELDPGFNEKDIGYGKFSKFITEAQQRGAAAPAPHRRRRLGGRAAARRRTATAQGARTAASAAERPERETAGATATGAAAAGARPLPRPRPRTRRDRDRPRYEPPAPIDDAPPATAPSRPSVEAAAAPTFAEPDVEAPARAPRAPAPSVPRARRRRRGARRRGPAAGPPRPAEAVDPLRNAYALLQHTVRADGAPPGETARDGDVKRRMLERSRASTSTRWASASSAASCARRTSRGGGRPPPGGRRIRGAAPGRRQARLPHPVLAAGAPRPAPRSRRTRPRPPPPRRTTARRPRRAADAARGRGRRGEPAGPPPLLPGQVVGGGAAPAEADARRGAARAETPRRAEPELTPAQRCRSARTATRW